MVPLCSTSCPLPVQSEYQGHIQMLMSYVDPSSDGIIVAGGDGTVMEVLNGLMQRQDAVSVQPSPWLYIPSGSVVHRRWPGTW